MFLLLPNSVLPKVVRPKDQYKEYKTDKVLTNKPHSVIQPPDEYRVSLSSEV